MVDRPVIMNLVALDVRKAFERELLGARRDAGAPEPKRQQNLKSGFTWLATKAKHGACRYKPACRWNLPRPPAWPDQL